MPKKPRLDDFVLVGEFCEVVGPRAVLTLPSVQYDFLNDLVLTILSSDLQAGTISHGSQFELPKDAQSIMDYPEANVFVLTNFVTLCDVKARGYSRTYCFCYVTRDQHKLTQHSEAIIEELDVVCKLLHYANIEIFRQDLEREMAQLNFETRALSAADDEEADNAFKEKTFRLKRLKEMLKTSTGFAKTERPKVRAYLSHLEGRGASQVRSRTHTFSTPHSTPTKERGFSLHSTDTSAFSTGSNASSSSGSQISLTAPTSSLRPLQDLVRPYFELAHSRLHKLLEYYRRRTTVLAMSAQEAELLNPPSSLLTIGGCIVLNFFEDPLALQQSFSRSPVLFSTSHRRRHPEPMFQFDTSSQSFTLQPSGSPGDMDGSHYDRSVSFHPPQDGVSFYSARESLSDTAHFVFDGAIVEDDESMHSALDELRGTDSDSREKLRPSPHFATGHHRTADFNDSDVTVDVDLSFQLDQHTVATATTNGDDDDDYGMSDAENALMSALTPHAGDPHTPVGPATEASDDGGGGGGGGGGGRGSTITSRHERISSETSTLVADITANDSSASVVHSRPGTHRSNARSRQAADDDDDGSGDSVPGNGKRIDKLTQLSMSSRFSVFSPASTQDQHMSANMSIPVTYGHTGWGMGAGDGAVAVPRISFQSAADHISYSSRKKPGYGMVQFVHRFSFAKHVVFALLSGRCVVVMGSPDREDEIRALIRTLRFFVVGHSHWNKVVPWRASSTLTFKDLSTVKLIGMPRSCVVRMHRPLLNFISILDLDEDVFTGLTYTGEALSLPFSIPHKQRLESTLLSCFHKVYLDLAWKAYLYYHRLCVRTHQRLTRPQASTQAATPWFDSVAERDTMKRLNVTGSDIDVVKYFAEVVKRQQTAHETMGLGDDSSRGQVPTVTLNYKPATRHFNTNTPTSSLSSSRA